MEDRHTLVASYTPVGPSGAPCADGVNRSFVAIYDGHNGFKAAEQCSSRWDCPCAPWLALSPPRLSHACLFDGPVHFCKLCIIACVNNLRDVSDFCLNKSSYASKVADINRKMVAPAYFVACLCNYNQPQLSKEGCSTLPSCHQSLYKERHSAVLYDSTLMHCSVSYTVIPVIHCFIARGGMRLSEARSGS